MKNHQHLRHTVLGRRGNRESENCVQSQLHWQNFENGSTWIETQPSWTFNSQQIFEIPSRKNGKIPISLVQVMLTPWTKCARNTSSTGIEPATFRSANHWNFNLSRIRTSQILCSQKMSINYLRYVYRLNIREVIQLTMHKSCTLNRKRAIIINILLLIFSYFHFNFSEFNDINSIQS